MLYIEILAVVVLTLVNGLLAMSELAVVSSRKSRLEQLAHQGNRGARAALLSSPIRAGFSRRFRSALPLSASLPGHSAAPP